MSGDTKAIIGTTAGTGLRVAGLLSAQISSGNASLNPRLDDLSDALNGRIDDLIAGVDRIEVRLDGFDERLRAVEIAFSKVDQRLETLERTLLPPAAPPD